MDRDAESPFFYQPKEKGNNEKNSVKNRYRTAGPAPKAQGVAGFRARGNREAQALKQSDFSQWCWQPYEFQQHAQGFRQGVIWRGGNKDSFLWSKAHHSQFDAEQQNPTAGRFQSLVTFPPLHNQGYLRTPVQCQPGKCCPADGSIGDAAEDRAKG